MYNRSSMKLTPEEIDVFKNMSESELGTFLATYMKRVQDYCYDSRNWKDGDTKESADLAARVIQETFINKIRSSKSQHNDLNPHE